MYLIYNQNKKQKEYCMIIKEKEFKSKQNYIQKLGDDAERQMAFYLKRHFGDSDKFFIFNDLKIKHNGETCQIDHLVLTTTGFFIIESKSCVGQISYDNKDQWIRHTEKRDYGMQSPIQQTELQIKVLKKFLQDANNDGSLIGTLVGKPQGFGARLYVKIVAIADNTIVKHPEDANPNVLKADAVSDFIKSQQRGVFSTFLSDDIGFTSKQVNSLVEFLKKQTEEENVSKPVVEDENVDSVSSKRIEYGRYGYYFKHEDDRNESIKEKCKNCGGKTKIRKSKNEFFLQCLSCDEEKLYWKNS